MTIIESLQCPQNITLLPGLEECLQSRPPLQLDLTGPKPTTYDPPGNLPWAMKSPSYTMRPKTQPEKGIVLNIDYPDLWIIQTYFSGPSFSLMLIILVIFCVWGNLFSFKLCDETSVGTEFVQCNSLNSCCACSLHAHLSIAKMRDNLESTRSLNTTLSLPPFVQWLIMSSFTTTKDNWLVIKEVSGVGAEVTLKQSC